jgi:nitroimidazol reductase NimA-like FMN-containing flavoprotein (pyridoxamine 5'-phosphate oxidase superfamily)
MSEVNEINTEVKEKILRIFSENDAVTVATTGGQHSPWVAGAYFASDDLKIYMLLETHGKSFANIKINSNVAVCISKNDAMKDFLQGSGEAVILNDSEEPEVRDLIVKKMSWFKTYTPVTPVRVDVKKFYVSSFESSWFPAKELEV